MAQKEEGLSMMHFLGLWAAKSFRIFVKNKNVAPTEPTVVNECFYALFD